MNFQNNNNYNFNRMGIPTRSNNNFKDEMTIINNALSSELKLDCMNQQQQSFTSPYPQSDNVDLFVLSQTQTNNKYNKELINSYAFGVIYSDIIPLDMRIIENTKNTAKDSFDIKNHPIIDIDKYNENIVRKCKEI